MPKVRVLTASDLHQRISLYAQLAGAVAQHKPDVIALVGDFLDAAELRVDTLTPEECARALTSLPCEKVIVRGNHEDAGWDDFEAAWHATGKPLHALHGSSANFGPLTVVGFPCFMGSDDYYAPGRQLPDYDPDAWLGALMRAAGPAGRTLWLIHEPPHSALAAPLFFESVWRDAVQQYQPLITVSGHDHTTPVRSGVFQATIGESVCINAGQRVYPAPGELIYCLLDFEFDSDKPSLPTSFTYRRLGGGSDPAGAR